MYIELHIHRFSQGLEYLFYATSNQVFGCVLKTTNRYTKMKTKPETIFLNIRLPRNTRACDNSHVDKRKLEWIFNLYVT